MVQATTFAVAGMNCGTCVRHVTRALEGMTGVIGVDVDLRHQQVTIEHLAEGIDVTGLTAALRDAGYTARLAE